MSSFRLTDCHAHLADAVFDSDREVVLRRAAAVGVAAVITVGETLGDAVRILELARQHDEIHPAVGLYPTHLDPDQADAVGTLIREHRDELVAVGEVGLDHWKVQDSDDRELQRSIFVRQVKLALELDLPLNVHSRSAGRQVIDLLLSEGARRVQLHAFDGKPSNALPAVDAGFFFSIPTSVVYSKQKQKLVRRLPLTSLLLETDSPVMAPVRGERNEPANITRALAAVAEIKSLSEAEVAERVEENTRRLYGF